MWPACKINTDKFTCTSGDGFSACPAEVGDGCTTVVDESWLVGVCCTVCAVLGRSDKHRHFIGAG